MQKTKRNVTEQWNTMNQILKGHGEMTAEDV